MLTQFAGLISPTLYWLGEKLGQVCHVCVITSTGSARILGLKIVFSGKSGQDLLLFIVVLVLVVAVKIEPGGHRWGLGGTRLVYRLLDALTTAPAQTTPPPCHLILHQVHHPMSWLTLIIVIYIFILIFIVIVIEHLEQGKVCLSCLFVKARCHLLLLLLLQLRLLLISILLL